ncbi:MAG: NAD(P)/FAD-dependent oxidoreductase [Alphaproteobacteria bacterium]|nr:NAD(P)/FAD-dependent oxidoreductase [Alphaproteobacteria bacterium]
MGDRPEIVVIGAGPAGATAALRLARVYLNVLLVDERAHAGGRGFPKPDEDDPFAAPDYRGQALRRGLREQAARIEHRAGWRAVDLAAGMALTIEDIASGRRETLVPRAVILATGGVDPKPDVPGADLPGVFALGDIESVLAASLEQPRARIVLGGSGPLLWRTAAELIGQRRSLAAVIDAASAPSWRQVMTMARQPGLLEQGLGWTRAVWGSRAALHRSSAIAQIRDGAIRDGAIRDGAIRDKLGALTVEIATLDEQWTPQAARRPDIAADIVALGRGMRPNLAALGSAGAVMVGDDGDGGPRLRRGDDLQTSVPGLYAAGDAGRVAGLDAALAEGTIAALSVARLFGRADDADLAAAAAEARQRLKALTPFLAAIDDWSKPRPGLMALAAKRV